MYLHLARLDIHTNNFAVKVKPPFFLHKRYEYFDLTGKLLEMAEI